MKVSLNEPWPPSAPPTAWPLRYHTTDPTPCPPRRKDTSVPGITKERGKRRPASARPGRLLAGGPAAVLAPAGRCAAAAVPDWRADRPVRPPLRSRHSTAGRPAPPTPTTPLLRPAPSSSPFPFAFVPAE